jgi:hypothetical protein
MERRKFVVGLGALATGTAAATGTGAFTNVSAQRSVNVELSDDSNAFLGLEPGESELVTDDGNGNIQINIDGTNATGSGANMNATTTIGDPDNPTDEYAFKVTNQGTQSVMFKMNYYFNNTGWIQNAGQGQSHINFEVFANANESASRDYPDQRNYNRDYSLGNAEGSGFGSNTGGYRFNVGEAYYVVITIDTTGDNASESDDLSGTAVIEADTETSSDSWYPDSPPSL